MRSSLPGNHHATWGCSHGDPSSPSWGARFSGEAQPLSRLRLRRGEEASAGMTGATCSRTRKRIVLVSTSGIDRRRCRRFRLTSSSGYPSSASSSSSF